MKFYFIDFLKKTTLISVLLSAFLLSCIFFLPTLNILYKHLYIILFFYLSGLIFHFILLNLSQKKIKYFTSYFMASILIKLIVYSVVIILYIINFKSDAKIFVSVFLIVYIIFTILEVISLQKFVRNIK